ncbi:MAG: hypothetical protein LBI87_11975 [Candidatus Accumulibacter sp.]|nr:hypothetical protein [Accumulibacter sp.]
MSVAALGNLVRKYDDAVHAGADVWGKYDKGNSVIESLKKWLQGNEPGRIGGGIRCGNRRWRSCRRRGVGHRSITGHHGCHGIWAGVLAKELYDEIHDKGFRDWFFDQDPVTPPYGFPK